MSNPLDSYSIDYHITVLPNVLYTGLHKASDIPEFTSFEIPSELRSQPVECRFVIYDEDGNHIEFSSQMVPAYSASVTNTVNLIPLKMVNNLVQRIAKRRKMDPPPALTPPQSE